MIAFHRFHRRQRSTKPGQRSDIWNWLALLVMLAIALFIHKSETVTLATDTRFIIFGLFTLLAVIVLIWWARGPGLESAIRKQWETGKLAKEFPERITLTPDGIDRASPTGSGHRTWKSIHAIHVTATHGYFYNNPDSAHVIPRHAFSSDAAFQDFMATAQRYRVAAVL